MSTGIVYLAGAGPGDPDLITVKARRVLESAELVFYDNLANEALLALAPADAERVYVGKKRAAHAFSQEEIISLLIDGARRGLKVVRLKGGDPYLFGRGGEEAEALAAARIPFEVIPGITAPLGLAAYAGVPLTHRDHTSAVTFVTGHEPARIDWPRLSAIDTLVIYMGVAGFKEIAPALIAAGRSPETPAIAVRWATRADQHTVEASLGELATAMEMARLKPPATIVIGEVVRLRERLNWFERLPLFGRRIVNTRARGQAAELTSRLAALGAETVELPVIDIQPAADPTPLERAIENLPSYDWLLFTSVNGVRFFFECLDRSSHDLRSLRARLAAIGPATRDALRALHLKVDLMPDEYVAESLVEAFGAQDLAGKRLLLPRAAVARDLAPDQLRRLGALVDVIEAYRTVAPEGANEQARRVFKGGRRPDWITFTSSSTVKNFLAVAGREVLEGVRVATIGPVTSETARRHGLTVHAEAAEYTIAGLVQTILESTHLLP